MVKNIRYSQHVLEKKKPFFKAATVDVNKITTECTMGPVLILDED